MQERRRCQVELLCRRERGNAERESAGEILSDTEACPKWRRRIWHELRTPKTIRPSRGMACTTLANLLLAREMKQAVIAVFTVLIEEPFFCEMVLVLDRQHHLAHVAIIGI